MILIELHYHGKRFSVNADYIAAVNSKQNEDGCEIFMVGDRADEFWNADESYEEVIELLKGR